MKISYTNLRIAHTKDSENHNMRSQLSKSILKENKILFKNDKVNLLNIDNKIYKFNTSKDVKNELKNYKLLKDKIRSEHVEVVKKEQKSGIKIPSFQEGVLTFSTNILVKFQKDPDKNFNIKNDNKNYTLDEISLMLEDKEKILLKIQDRLRLLNFKKNKSDEELLLLSKLKSDEIKLKKEFNTINDTLKPGFNIQLFNEIGLKTFKELEEKLNIKILYSTLHLDEKTPHFHFEFENFARDKNGIISNKGKAIFTRTNSKNLDNTQDNNIKNIGKTLQDLAIKYYKDYGILRGKSKEESLKIDSKYTYKKQSDYWNEKIEEDKQISKDLSFFYKQLEVDKQKEIKELEEIEQNLLYKNLDLDKKNNDELKLYEDNLILKKNDISSKYNKEIKSIEISKDLELKTIQNELSLLKINSSDTIQILKDLRMFLSKNQKIQVDTKKLIYSIFSNNQDELRNLNKDIIKQKKEINSIDKFDKFYDNKINEIIAKSKKFLSFDTQLLKDNLFNEIRHILDTEYVFKELDILKNEVKNKDLEIEKLKNEVKNKELELIKEYEENNDLNDKLDKFIIVKNLQNKNIETLKNSLNEANFKIQQQDTQITRLQDYNKELLQYKPQEEMNLDNIKIVKLDVIRPFRQ